MRKGKRVGRAERTRGRGTVFVEETNRGEVFVTCTGCRMAERPRGDARHDQIAHARLCAN